MGARCSFRTGRVLADAVPCARSFPWTANIALTSMVEHPRAERWRLPQDRRLPAGMLRPEITIIFLDPFRIKDSGVITESLLCTSLVSDVPRVISFLPRSLGGDAQGPPAKAVIADRDAGDEIARALSSESNDTHFPVRIAPDERRLETERDDSGRVPSPGSIPPLRTGKRDLLRPKGAGMRPHRQVCGHCP